MTRRLYHDNAYLTSFEARILDVISSDKGYELILNQTAFYPEAGGQPSDRGILGGAEVLDVFERDDIIVHLVSSGEFKTNDKIKGEIDFERRIENMRRHTGQHILSRAFVEIAEADTVSANLGENCSIEISSENMDDKILRRAEKKANEIVLSDIDIKTVFHDQTELKELDLRKIPDREGAFRIIKIGDFDHNACGGTHCARSGEVGLIKIIGTENLRGHTRIYFLAGKTALVDYQNKHSVITDLMGQLTCHFDDLPGKVAKLTEEHAQLRRTAAQLNRRLFELELRDIIIDSKDINGKKILIQHFEDVDNKQLKDITLQAVNAVDGIVLFSSGDKLLIGCSQNAGLKAGNLAKEYMEHFGGKGGGGPTLAQIGGLDENSIKPNVVTLARMIEEHLV
jgi:alanyl-tRNA synthetase